MNFTKEKTVDGVVQRDFTIDHNGETVPCVIWAPEGATGQRPLVLMGHGGSQHKKTEGIRLRATRYANMHGWATLAIDAPGHGDRITREEAEALGREVGARVRGEATGPSWTPERLKMMAERTQRAIPEWKAALDTALSFDFVAETKTIGYWGVSMGTAIGVPFVASEARIRCAVFGLAGLRPDATDFEQAAKSITIPVQFVFQWQDAVATHEAGIALFEAFGSKEKTMHINPGGHMETPSFEGHAWEAFYLRHFK
ncbi:MAG TPA: hypothetical protein VJ998_04335 [Pseudomonadales bacterium]|nr:hypothetical protein [Pseudomonadales bacterium]